MLICEHYINCLNNMWINYINEYMKWKQSNRQDKEVNMNRIRKNGTDLQAHNTHINLTCQY